MPSSLPSLLERALSSVGETTFCDEALRESLADVIVAVHVDGQQCWLRGGATRVDVLTNAPDAAGVTVCVTARGADLLDVLDGRLELLQLLRSSSLRVRGAAGAAARAFSALKYFVEGCARSSDGPRLMLEFRNSFGARDA
jgi:hypothetical protein